MASRVRNTGTSGKSRGTGSSNKSSTAQKNSKTRKSGSTGKPSGSSKNSRAKKTPTQKKESSAQGSGLKKEIVLLIALLAAVLLELGAFGVGGKVGDSFSRVFFGIFGLLFYVFPIVSFFTFTFVMVNRKNPLIWKKLIGIILCFICLCGITHMFTSSYDQHFTLIECFKIGYMQKTGGGILGAGLSKLLINGFGVLGAYVILFFVFLISVILMTQHQILAPIRDKGKKVYHDAMEQHTKKKMEAPEKPQRKKREAAHPEKVFDVQLKPGDTEVPKEKKVEDSKRFGRSQRGIVTELFPQESELFIPGREEELIEPKDLEDYQGEEGNKPSRTVSFDQARKKNPKSSPEEISQGIEDIQEEIEKKEEGKKDNYVFPPMKLLKEGRKGPAGDSDEAIRETAAKLESTLYNFGVNVTITNVSCGPTVTRYELQPELGVKVSKILSLTDDIKLNLAASDIRIEAPIPGKAAIGIEVPNKTNSAVMLRDLLETREFQNFPSKLAFAVGEDIGGKTIVADIEKMPHLLIAGATGSGKSVCINTLIMSILYKASPEEVKLIMIDPKVVELSVYNGIPHLFIPVVTDPKKAAGALNWAVSEMTDRYNLFAKYNVRDIAGYNKKIQEMTEDLEMAEDLEVAEEEKPVKLPKIIIIVDELADLMMVAPGEVEDSICRLAQLARAAGIHLILATQRPSVNVITGLIKANMPSRIAFSVSSGVDSRTILDMNGAEKLLGRGDMLYYPQGLQKPARLQGSFVSDGEVSDVVNFLKEQQKKEPVYNKKITEMIDSSSSGSGGNGSNGDVDAYFVDAGKCIIEKDKASIGMLQRVFKIGFNRAARIMDQLADAGVVGPEEGTKPRKVLMSKEEFENYIEESL